MGAIQAVQKESGNVVQTEMTSGDQKWPEALESQNASDKSSNLTLNQAPKTHKQDLISL